MASEIARAVKPEAKQPQHEIRQPSDPNLDLPKRMNDVAESLLPDLFKKDRLEIRPRNIHQSNKPDSEGDKPKPPDKPKVTFVAGGAPPPGDDDTVKNWSNPDFDHEHGTLQNFVDKHTYKPADKNPESPKDKKQDTKKEDDETKEKPSIAELKKKAFRGDKDIHSEVNEKDRRKFHINENGDLEPANPEGKYKDREVTVAEHINGSFFKYAKAQSPYTSFGSDGVVEKYGDKHIVTVD